MKLTTIDSFQRALIGLFDEKAFIKLTCRFWKQIKDMFDVVHESKLRLKKYSHKKHHLDHFSFN